MRAIKSPIIGARPPYAGAAARECVALPSNVATSMLARSGENKSRLYAYMHVGNWPALVPKIRKSLHAISANREKEMTRSAHFIALKKAIVAPLKPGDHRHRLRQRAGTSAAYCAIRIDEKIKTHRYQH